MTRALLAMDFQNGIAGEFTGTGVLEKAAQAVEAARSAGIPVVWVRVSFRPGFPEVPAEGSQFSALRGRGEALEQDKEGTQILEQLAPRPEEPVVLKRRVSAFTGSDLDVVLRATGATELVLAGIATSGVVLSTTRQAADLDFSLTVLSDACADRDEEVHRVLMEKVLAHQATVVTTEEWVAGL